MMQRIPALLLFFTAVCIPLAAQDGGIKLQGDFAVDASQAETLLGTFKLAPWFALPLDRSGSMFDGTANVRIGFAATPPEQATLILDGDIQTLRLIAKGRPGLAGDPELQFEVGRIPFRDGSSLFLSDSADGFRTSFRYPDLGIDLAAGYTGLKTLSTTSFHLSRTDLNRLADPLDFFAPRRLLMEASGTYKPAQDMKIGLQFLMQHDLNDPANYVAIFSEPFESVRGGPVNTQYTSADFLWDISPVIALRSSFTYGSGTVYSHVADNQSLTGRSWQSTPVQSFLGSLGMNLRTPEFLGGRFGLLLIAASGDGDAESVIEGNTAGSSTMFLPVSPASLAAVSRPGLSNLLLGQISASVKPANELDLRTGLDLTFLFKPDAGPSGIPGVAAGATGYAGTELDLNLQWKIFTDLSLSCSGGIYLPSPAPAGASLSGQRPVQYQAAITINLEA